MERDLAAGRLPSVQPFHAMAYPFPPPLCLAISRAYAAHCLSAARRMAPAAGLRLAHPPARRLRPGQRLRVGYVSSDFGNHPLSHLMGAVFGMHDRRRAGVHGGVAGRARGMEGCRACMCSRPLLATPGRAPPDAQAGSAVRTASHLQAPSPPLTPPHPPRPHPHFAARWRCSATRCRRPTAPSGAPASRRRRSTLRTSPPGRPPTWRAASPPTASRCASAPQLERVASA